MGMSSSQARLLNLTGRLHDIEYKAAKLEAQKLQMANESRHVYENYLNALEAKKVQYKFINSNGSFGYRDATLASLENGGLDSYNGHTSSQTYLLQDSETGLIYVTPEFAAKYGITNSSGVEKVTTLEAYINDHKSEIPTRPVMRNVEDYSKLLSATPAECRLVTEFNPNPQEYYPNVTLATGIGRTIEKTPGYVTNGVAASIDTTPTPKTDNYITINNYNSCVAKSIKSTTTKNEYTISNTNYLYKSPVTYTFTPEMLSRTAKKYTISFGVLQLTETQFYPGIGVGGNYVVGDSSSSTNNTTAETALIEFANNTDGVEYDTETRTLSIRSSSSSPISQFAALYAADGNSNHSIEYNELNAIKTSSSTESRTFNLDTKISDYTYSTSNHFYINIDGSNVVYGGNKSIYDVTTKDYLDWIKSQDNYKDLGINYEEDEEGIHLYINEGHSISIPCLNGSTYTTKTTLYNFTLLLTEIAANITLANGICNFDSSGNAGSKSKTESDYLSTRDADISDTIEKLKGYLPLFDSTFNEKVKIVAEMSDDLCNALQKAKNGNKNDLITVTRNINSFLDGGSYTPISNSYETKINTTGATKNVTKYESSGYGYGGNFNTNATIGTEELPTGETIPTVKINYSANDIKLLLAYEMYKDDPTVNPNNKVSEVEGILSNYLSGRTTDKLLASLLTTYNSAATAEKTALIDRLKTNSLTTSDANLYDSYDDNYVQLGNTNLLTVSVPAGAKYEVECPNKKDMIIKLIDDIYHGNNNFVYDDMQAAYNKLNTLSDKELASIFSYYGTGDWNAIKGLVKTELEAATFDKTNLADYTKKATEHLSYNNSNAVVSNTAGNSIFTKHADSGTGSVKIPSIDNIATNLLIAFRTIDPNIKESDFKSMLTSRYGNGTNNNNITLELINRVCADYIKNYLQNNNTPDSDLQSKVQNILNHLKNGSSLNIADSNYQPYDSSKYNVSMQSSTSISYRYDTKQEPTGQEELNTDSDEYKALVQKYYQLLALQDYEFEIKNDTNLTESSEYLSNLLIDGGFTLINFSGDIKNLPNTSVSVEPSLQEVPDEKELRKAEAQYEADMHRIDRKDRMYDTQLAALDSERNAIKQEMETLKTVAKDNVERTFKLFG